MIDERIVAHLWDPQDRQYALMPPQAYPPVGPEPEGAQRVNIQILARPAASPPDYLLASWYAPALRVVLRNKLIAKCAEEGYTLLCVDDPDDLKATIGYYPGTIAYFYQGWAAARRDAPLTRADTQYEDLLRQVMQEGVHKADRTGTGTRSVFGRQLRYPLSAGYPLITTKRVHFRSLAYELLWFLRGDSNVQWLRHHGVGIWDEWASPEGDLGPVYGTQWRSWSTPDGGYIDQIAQVLHTLKTDPSSRRMVVSAWNVGEIPQMALPPCHAFFQFYVADGKLSCQVYQRSADLFLGVPFNIASYALLTHMIAEQTGLGVGELIWTGGDCHIYDNHVEQVELQLSREVRRFPTLRLAAASSLFGYTFEDFTIEGYDPHPGIKAPVAV